MENLGKYIRRPALSLALLGAILAAILLWQFWPENDDADRPVLGLSTSLPLYWGEGDIGDVMNDAAQPLPAYLRLNEKYEIRLIDAFEPQNLKKFDHIILAQPRAVSPSEFVAINAWVRGGGTLLLLADPALQWESIYPLGDKRRPLFTSLMSPLLSHWGVELILPLDGEGKNVREVQAGGFDIRTVTPGAWQARAGKNSACIISANAFLADCTLDKGRVILIADADLLASEYWRGTGVRSIFGNDDFENIAMIEAFLDGEVKISAE